MKEITKEIKEYLIKVGYPIKEHIYYLEVWLWLWKERDVRIEPLYNLTTCISGLGSEFQLPGYTDPEEAIACSIEFIVVNDLL